MQGSKSTWCSDAVNQLRLKHVIFMCSIKIIMDTQSLLFHRQNCICQWIKKGHILIINSISILNLIIKVSINSQQLHKIKLISVFTRKISFMYVDTLLMAYFKVNNYLFVLQVDSLFYSSENLFYSLVMICTYNTNRNKWNNAKMSWSSTRLSGQYFGW